MKPSRNWSVWVAVMALAVTSLMAGCKGDKEESAKASPENDRTLANLQAAYEGESNAHARYTAFAAKADEEGFSKAASLFRAAAQAEQIHASNHAEVIKKLGGTPTATIKDVEVKSTAENLKAAVAGETYERDTMYPEFIEQARKAKNAEAVKTFTLAKTAEAEHAKLYQAALDDLDNWKQAATFYVCQVCGFTSTELPTGKCPSCFSPLEKFEKVS